MEFDVSMVLFRSPLALVHRTLSCLASQRSGLRRLWVLESGASDEGVANSALTRIIDLEFRRKTTLILRPDNLGFAAGHNLLAGLAFEGGASHLLVLNPDMRLADDALEQFLSSVNGRPGMAIHGPLLRRAPSATGVVSDSGVIDSRGIGWTASGRHFDLGQGKTLDVKDAAGGPRKVEGISGAALALDRQTWHQLHLSTGRFFDPLFVAYREDAELGVRIRCLGGHCYVHPVSGFAHVRRGRNAERTSEIEKVLGVRNRFLLRWVLGRSRPGVPLIAALRDLMVALATCTVERSSFPGLLSAWRIRRTMRYRSRRVRGERFPATRGRVRRTKGS